MSLKIFVSPYDASTFSNQGFTPVYPPPEVHPRNYKKVMEACRENFNKIATVNPYFLEHARPEEVFNIDGRPLTAHPEWGKWEKVMSVGEFWSSISGRDGW